jgi:formate/nitrite transporter FocA (FNT family)
LHNSEFFLGQVEHLVLASAQQKLTLFFSEAVIAFLVDFVQYLVDTTLGNFIGGSEY